MDNKKQPQRPRRSFKPGNMLYPAPAVLVTVADREGNSNMLTVAWAGTVCTNPPMLSISVRPERYSYSMLRETGEFAVNLTTEDMAFATDYCGVRSGRDTDKWKDTGLTKAQAEKLRAPLIAESPVSLECRVVKVEELGSHHLFLAEIVAVSVNAAYIDEKDTFHLDDAKLLAYSHGRYYGLGECLGSFGYSVRKRPERKAAGENTAGAARQDSQAAEKNGKAARQGGRTTEKSGRAVRKTGRALQKDGRARKNSDRKEKQNG